MSPFQILLELRVTEVVVATGAIRLARLQSKNHPPPTNQYPVFTGRMPFLSPNQQCQRTEGKMHRMNLVLCANQSYLCPQPLSMFSSAYLSDWLSVHMMNWKLIYVFNDQSCFWYVTWPYLNILHFKGSMCDMRKSLWRMCRCMCMLLGSETCK